MIDGHALCVDSKLRSGAGSPWLAPGAGCGHCPAVFLGRWHQWLMTAPPVLSPLEPCPAPFYPGVRPSLQIGNGPWALIPSRRASPCCIIYFRVACVGIFGQAPCWPPPPLPAWPHGSARCVPTLHTHLSFPDCPWLSGGLSHLMLTLLGCHSWCPLPKFPSHSINLRHHCQIHSAKISLKRLFPFFFLIPDSLQDQIKTGAYNSWLFTICPNLWAPLFFTTPFAQNKWSTWTRLCSLTLDVWRLLALRVPCRGENISPPFFLGTTPNTPGTAHPGNKGFFRGCFYCDPSPLSHS